MDLTWQRGIFLVPKIRAILIKLIYNSIKDEVEFNLSTSNIGSRKGRAARDHVFVVNSVINVTLRCGHHKDFVFYKLTQCFDSLWVSKSFLDLYSNGVNSSLLNLLYELSKKVNVSIKTPVGVTEEEEIEEVVLQGETLSGFVCTNSVDKISIECELKPVKYRDMDLPKLGYVNDILDIT